MGMGPMLRQKEREELHARIRQVLLKDPRPSVVLAQRFGVTADLIRRLARSLGVDLPRSEYLPTKKMKKFNRRQTGKWGPMGLV